MMNLKATLSLILIVGGCQTSKQDARIDRLESRIESVENRQEKEEDADLKQAQAILEQYWIAKFQLIEASAKHHIGHPAISDASDLQTQIWARFSTDRQNMTDADVAKSRKKAFDAKIFEIGTKLLKARIKLNEKHPEVVTLAEIKSALEKNRK
ncbi:hypothetical protein JYT83_00980 [bacterium AH-315-F18]|nr:hypothetical protein [bacterium AH-315-F18]